MIDLEAVLLFVVEELIDERAALLGRKNGVVRIVLEPTVDVELDGRAAEMRMSEALRAMASGRMSSMDSVPVAGVMQSSMFSSRDMSFTHPCYRGPWAPGPLEVLVLAVVRPDQIRTFVFDRRPQQVVVDDPAGQLDDEIESDGLRARMAEQATQQGDVAEKGDLLDVLALLLGQQPAQEDRLSVADADIRGRATRRRLRKVRVGPTKRRIRETSGMTRALIMPSSEMRA